MSNNRPYKRILLKLSGEAMAGDIGFGFCAKTVKNIAAEVDSVAKAGFEIAVVIGGGNFMRGEAMAQAGMDRVNGDYMGMMATMMNAMMLRDVLEKMNTKTALLSALHLKEIGEPYIRRNALEHLSNGKVVIFAGGTGSPFFTTDTTATLRANEINADVIFKATNVDGIYTADPKKDATATKYERLSFMDVLKNELRVMDATAIAMCKENNLPIQVFCLQDKGSVLKAAQGEPIGTIVGA